MRDSLSKILVHYYPLAGRLTWIEGHHLQLNCNTKGVMLLEAESPKTLSSYGDFTPSDTVKNELTPPIDYTQPIEDLPLLLVQLTRFTEQGLVIGVSFNHVLWDGLAATRFINSWAKLCILGTDALDRSEKFPLLDRTVLNSSSTPRFEHLELKPLPLLLEATDTAAEQKHKKTAVVLSLTKEQVEKMKEKSNNNCLDEQDASFSQGHCDTYVAVSAHVWRSATKARGFDELQPTVVRVSADIRNRLNLLLPMNYFRNALAVVLTMVCFAGEISSNPVGYGAGKIREAVETLKEDYVRSQLDFIRCQERSDWIRASYLDCREAKNAPFYGNPNLTIVSWMSMPVYEADFGWGEPERFGPGSVYLDGKVYFIRSSDGDGSLVVSVHLQTRHMELFKKFFYQDI